MPTIDVDQIFELAQSRNDLLQFVRDDQTMRIGEVQPAAFVFEENFIDLWFNRMHV